MADNNADFENQLLQNALLFTAIRKHKAEEEKVKKVSKYLNQGAEINATDANDKFNTPLHVAVLKGEIEVVKFLVEKGASITLTNSNGQTAIDIATIINTSKSLAITEYFMTLLKEQCGNIQKQVNTPNSATKSDAANKDTTMPLIYCKRSGTSALSGQLYETKLLSLILLRALHDNEITEFYLGVNLEMLPTSLNGIYIKYKLKNCEKWKIILLQVQHKDDPAKDKVTVDSILKLKGDLSLYAYLVGYQNLWPKSLAEYDCEIVAFTTAFENFFKKHTVNNTDSTRFLTIDRAGKMFQFDYDENNLNNIIDSMQVITGLVLIQSLCAMTLQNGKVNHLLIRYQAFLAHNVLELDYSNSSYSLGKFRPTFLKSNDLKLFSMKSNLLKEIKKNQQK
ncbi:uncharacterized protein LOC111353967 isoform X2 [Spodoptera litura]|uniref:Uncharacterized protein LOC111353967 isoform X2 n=1 Tax=Spodoptera litura TaxID=69820 RepID=A0A9J7E626_SPOLT|nr:uncharacterized protein LOC111353967 isoform X2 [Spodoptera litura]